MCVYVNKKSFVNVTNKHFACRSNAESMSPSGRLPFIKAGAFVVSEMDPIVGFVNTKVHTEQRKATQVSRLFVMPYLAV